LTRRFQKGELAVEPESANTFSRRFRGYDPAAVDAHVEMLSTKQQLLLDDVESLRARLKGLGDEAAALRQEVDVLTETSPSPQAVQKRMAQMLQRAVDEVSELQAEARAEAEALIEDAEAEARAAQENHNALMAGLVAERSALEAEQQETRKKFDAELTNERAQAQLEIVKLWHDVHEERKQLLADAKQEADHYREQARRAVDEAGQQRITILEQLMGVYRDLEGVPATLEAAYQEAKNPPEENSESSGAAASDGKVSPR
jgi:cell division septum initiation protein DivIVA